MHTKTFYANKAHTRRTYVAHVQPPPTGHRIIIEREREIESCHCPLPTVHPSFHFGCIHLWMYSFWSLISQKFSRKTQCVLETTWRRIDSIQSVLKLRDDTLTVVVKAPIAPSSSSSPDDISVSPARNTIYTL